MPADSDLAVPCGHEEEPGRQDPAADGGRGARRTRAAPIREIYAFGSWVRGAAEPGDLDLIIVHDPPSEALLEEYRVHGETVASVDGMMRYFYPDQRFRASMGKALRKPGESADLLLAKSLPEALNSHGHVKPEEVRLIWSQVDDDAEAVIASIAVDPDAGRAERPEFISVKRAGCTARWMRIVVQLIDEEVVELTQDLLPDETPPLDLDQTERMNHWRAVSTFGKEALKCAPHALKWFEEQGDTQVFHSFGEGSTLANDDDTRLAMLGKMHLHWMMGRLDRPEAEAVCMIPHLKKRQPNERFVFRRGPRWDPEWAKRSHNGSR